MHLSPEYGYELTPETMLVTESHATRTPGIRYTSCDHVGVWGTWRCWDHANLSGLHLWPWCPPDWNCYWALRLGPWHQQSPGLHQCLRLHLPPKAAQVPPDTGTTQAGVVRTDTRVYIDARGPFLGLWPSLSQRLCCPAYLLLPPGPNDYPESQPPHGFWLLGPSGY